MGPKSPPARKCLVLTVSFLQHFKSFFYQISLFDQASYWMQWSMISVRFYLYHCSNRCSKCSQWRWFWRLPVGSCPISSYFTTHSTNRSQSEISHFSRRSQGHCNWAASRTQRGRERYALIVDLLESLADALAHFGHRHNKLLMLEFFALTDTARCWIFCAIFANLV